MSLREYQRHAAENVISELNAGTRSVLAVLPTGGGKTILAIEGLIRPYIDAGKRVWFIAPRRQLINQTSEKLTKYKLYDHGIMMATNKRNRPLALVQVISKDTLARRLDKRYANEPDLLIFDEGHHATDDNTYQKILDRFPNAKCAGLTATPIRLDGKGMGRVYDKMIEVASIADLIDMGYLVPPRVFRGQSVDTSGIKTRGGDYRQKDLAEAVNTQVLNGEAVKNWTLHAEERRTVCFCVTIEHSESVAESFNDAGIKAGHIDYKTPEKERVRLLKELEQGEIKVLTSVGVFTEGFDMPVVGCVMFLRPTKSLSLYIQMGGRGLRPAAGVAEDGENCIVLDHAGLTAEFGHLTEVREWTLQDGVIEDDGTKQFFCDVCGEEFRSVPKVCPSCGAILKRDGEDVNVREVVNTDEILIEDIDPNMDAAAIAQRREKYKRMAAYYQDIALYGFDRQWDPKAVCVKFQKHFSEWPDHKLLEHIAHDAPVVVRYDHHKKAYYYQVESQRFYADDMQQEVV